MFALLLAAASPAAVPPPLAEARIAFDTRRITAVAVRGIADKTTNRTVTADDPVRWASVSKLVVALGVMRLVEAGKLDLDRDVSAYLGWPVRHPAWPEITITMRMLLSHTSGLRDDADYAIPFGETVRERLANPRAWDVDRPPGRWFRYSNLNFPVVASVMEAASGERFDRLMQREVFVPLKLDTCFNWTTCSDAKIARAVALYDVTGPVRTDALGGKRPACPVNTKAGCDLSAHTLTSNGALFSPQGGMRASVRDLSRIGQMLLRRGDRFLKPASVDAIFEPQWTFDGSNGDTEGGFYCAYGLATQTLAVRQPDCHDDLFGDGRPRVGHAGEAYGLRSGLWLDRARGTGVAFFATAVPNDAFKGATAYTAVEERLARGR
jgi:CubicO group peptidase (beta-lactamase class C family)